MTWHPVYSHSAHADNLWNKMPKWRSTQKRDVTNVRFLHNTTTCRKNEIYDVKLRNYAFRMIYYLSLGKKEKCFNNTNLKNIVMFNLFYFKNILNHIKQKLYYCCIRSLVPCVQNMYVIFVWQPRPTLYNLFKCRILNVYVYLINDPPL